MGGKQRELRRLAASSKVLVVGAGGIGCELLKDLVLAGFTDVEIIDLDTIDVSNLNRQFLFHKEHVGKSKACVARESALRFNPNANIIAHHANITSSHFDINYFKRFKLVMNALDNRAARNHVNRLCLAADLPLIESGTAGYNGQVELIKRGLTQCYECQPKATPKNFPGCTIRNTPSELIHCIVWAKHLFNQLFGEADDDEDVSPDTADPEAAGSAGIQALSEEANAQGNVNRVNTRSWANTVEYDPTKLFNKFFRDDIKYLLCMKNLWEKRRPPTPLDIKNLPETGTGSSSNEGGLRDQRIWSITECVKVFTDSCYALRDSLSALVEKDHLVWDKDDKNAMDFVAACANIRSYIFGIAQDTRFQIKSMAGNIIPAIATANAIIAGIVVMHAFNILQSDLLKCQSVYLRLKPNPRGQLFVPDRGLTPPNPTCYVCAAKPSLHLVCDINKMTGAEFSSTVLIGRLNMISPDVMHNNSVLLSCEEGETEMSNNKTLYQIGVRDGSILKVDDFLQDYELRVIILDKPDCEEFEIIAGSEIIKPKNENGTNGNGNGTDYSDPQPGSSKVAITNDDDSDFEIVEGESFEENSKKLKQTVDSEDMPQAKKPKVI